MRNIGYVHVIDLEFLSWKHLNSKMLTEKPSYLLSPRSTRFWENRVVWD